jgi:DNA-binding NarL/FixJ family response regulator
MIRVLLVDDHPLMRKGIRTVLEAYEDITIVGEASNGIEAINLANAFKPDIIVMDVNMPQMDGVQATRLIKRNLPRTTIIGLSVNESAMVKQSLMEAGASTYLNKVYSSRLHLTDSESSPGLRR